MGAVSSVSFSVCGEWLTDFIRGRFLDEGMSFAWVVETIGEILKGNDLSTQRVREIAQDIILGKSYFKGNTGDGSFVYCDGSDEPTNTDFFDKYSEMREELRQERQARKDAQEAWQELALVFKGEMNRDYCACKVNIDFLKPTLPEEFIERMVKPDEDVAPYGYIAPDGTFHKVDWCDHEEFAWKVIREQHREEEAYDEFTGKDFLILTKGWLLLHNPSRGKPFLTSGDRPMTKAQRETLYDYYIKYGMKEDANALYKEGDLL